MYSRMLIPLDGSKTAEKVLPYARFVAGALKLPIELLAVLDIVEMATHTSADRARYLVTLIADGVRRSGQYIGGIARTLHNDAQCAVEKAEDEPVIMETAATSKGELVATVTHGRS